MLDHVRWLVLAGALTLAIAPVVMISINEETSATLSLSAFSGAASNKHNLGANDCVDDLFAARNVIGLPKMEAAIAECFNVFHHVARKIRVELRRDKDATTESAAIVFRQHGSDTQTSEFMTMVASVLLTEPLIQKVSVCATTIPGICNTHVSYRAAY